MKELIFAGILGMVGFVCFFAKKYPEEYKSKIRQRKIPAFYCAGLSFIAFIIVAKSFFDSAWFSLNFVVLPIILMFYVLNCSLLAIYRWHAPLVLTCFVYFSCTVILPTPNDNIILTYQLILGLTLILIPYSIIRSVLIIRSLNALEPETREQSIIS